MSQQSVDRIGDWIKWFYEHKDDGGDVHKKIKFLMKAVDGCLELLVLALIDIQKLEGREKSGLLKIPNFMRFNK